MKSLRQLTAELTGPRLDATNIAQWQVQVTLDEHARIALNDAIAAFPPRIHAVYNSGVVIGNVCVLPRAAQVVHRVELASSTAALRQLTHWEVRPSPFTMQLHIADANLTGAVRVTYEYTQPPLPATILLSSDSYASVECTGASPVYTWPKPPMFIEFHKMTGSYDYREVAMYEAYTPTGFTGLVRGAEGYTRYWWSGSTISPCWVADERLLRPIMLLSQAVFYEFMIRDRASYDQYTAIASVQAMPMEDLQVLIRDLEGRARVSWDHATTRRLPPPSRGTLRKPIRS